MHCSTYKQMLYQFVFWVVKFYCYEIFEFIDFGIGARIGALCV